MIDCPLCDSEIDVDEDELDEGDSLLCEECGSEVIVTGLSPLELSPVDDDEFDEDEEFAYDEDEDEDEEDEDEEDDEDDE